MVPSVKRPAATARVDTCSGKFAPFSLQMLTKKIEKSNKIIRTLIAAQCLNNQMFVGKFPIK